MKRGLEFIGLVVFAAVLAGGPRPAVAASAADIERGAIAALNKLYASTPAAKLLGEKAARRA